MPLAGTRASRGRCSHADGDFTIIPRTWRDRLGDIRSLRSAVVTGVAPAALVATLAVALGSGLGAAPAMAQDADERVPDRLVVGDLSPGALALVDAAFVPEGAGAGVPSPANAVGLASIAQMADFNTVGAGLPIPGPAEFGRETVGLDNISLANIGPDYADPADRAGLPGRQRPRRDYASFGEDVKAIKWEFAAVAGYYTATNAPKLFKDPQFPTFQNEGWFGRSTNNVGVDKLAHAYSAYVISELLYGRLKRNTGDAPGIEWTAAALGSGIMLWSEAFDSIEPTSGWSWEDVAMNTAGAGFSVLRNSVPESSVTRLLTLAVA